MSQATTITALETRRDVLVLELAAIGVMGPNFSLDGVSIDWLAYGTRLREEIMALIAVIEQLNGPVVVYSIAR